MTSELDRASLAEPGPALPRAGTRLPARRRLAGLAVALTGLPVVTVTLSALRDELSLGAVLMLYLLVIVLTSAIGGLGPGALAAAVSFLLANWFLVPPFHTLSVGSRDAILELVVFAVVAGVVSATVHLAAREQANAARSRIESEVLSRFTAQPVSTVTLDSVLEEVRTTFGMTSAALVRRDRSGSGPRAGASAGWGSAGAAGAGLGSAGAAGAGTVLARVGPQESGPPSISIQASDGLLLVAHGPTLFAEDRGFLGRLAANAARAWEGQQLAEQAAFAVELEAAGRARSALLAAVGHDLRTPLAGIKASVSSLRQEDIDWTPQEQGELLAAIEDGADRLNGLIVNLLDMSRLEADAVTVRLAPVALDEVVARALLHVGSAEVSIEIPDNLPLILSDAGLLERVVANIVDNARRYAVASVRITARQVADQLELAVVDDGPGVREQDWSRIFTPFQRLDDRSADSGVGLGLAIAQGFAEAIHARVSPGTSPGGGLTMTISLPLAAP